MGDVNASQYYTVISLFKSTRLFFFNRFIIYYLFIERYFNVAIVIPINPNLIINEDIFNRVDSIRSALRYR